MLLDQRNGRAYLFRGEGDAVMWDAPDRFDRSRIVRKARNEVPMNVRKLIAQQLVIHLSCLKRFGEHFGQAADFFHQLDALGRRKME